MALTQGQIESFYLICMAQVSCQYGAYVTDIQNGLSVYDQTPIEEKFYKINSMMAVIWGYDPLDESNCLSVAEVESICWYLQKLLCFSLELKSLAPTYLNQQHEFLWNEFKPYEFN